MKNEDRLKKYEDLFNEGLKQKQNIEAQLWQIKGAIGCLKEQINDEDNERSVKRKDKKPTRNSK
jgi:hypothetical protein